LWGITTDVIHVFKRHNKISSIYIDNGPSIDITLPLCKIIDKNSTSWLDLFTFEVCSRLNCEFLDGFCLNWGNNDDVIPSGFRFNRNNHDGVASSYTDKHSGSDEIEKNTVDMRYDFDLGATDNDIFVCGRSKCRCDSRCYNSLHMEQMFAMKKSSEDRDWKLVPQRHEYYQNWMLTKCCFVSRNVLVAVGVARNTKMSDIASDSCTMLELYDFHNFFQPSTANACDNSLAQWKVLKTNVPNNILNASLVSCTDSDEMYLIGGFVYEHGLFKNGCDIEDILLDICKVSNRVFKGTYLKSEQDIKWSEVDSLIDGRGGHVSFMMGSNIYVAGGFMKSDQHKDKKFKKTKEKEAVIQTSNWTSSCEKYDLKEQRWSNCPHIFPPISITLDSYGVSSDLLNATVSRDGKSAIITCKEEFSTVGDDIGMMISFTEKDGFKVHEKACFKSIKSKRIATLATRILEPPYKENGFTRIPFSIDSI
jgi:hypothetical protein